MRLETLPSKENQKNPYQVIHEVGVGFSAYQLFYPNLRMKQQIYFHTKPGKKK